MMDADDRLKALFAMDEPPARDPAFSASVMADIARRRFLMDVAMLSGVSILGALVLWAAWPALAPLLSTLGRGLSPVMASLTLAATAVILLEGRVTSATALKHD
jgi:hypothetical protein